MIPRKNHPRGHRASPVGERIERQIDDFARIGIARTCTLCGGADLRGDRIGKMGDQGALKIRSRTKMMEQIGVGPTDPRGDGLECHGLRTLLDQQCTRGFDRGITGFFRAEATTVY